MMDKIEATPLQPAPAVLLTPGPLTTSGSVRAALQHDWGSWDVDFRELTRWVRRHLLIAAGLPAEGAGMACVPLQGSGTFAVEAAVGTLVPPEAELLVLVNGAYGRRIAAMCRAMGRRFRVLEGPEEDPVDPAAVEAALIAHPSITHMAVVHCETSTGILNPLPALAAVAARAQKPLLIDAMSSFGILPIPIDPDRPLAIIASANKGLQGPPGLGFVLAQENALAAAEGRSPSLSLDLHDQWRYMERTGQFRFTPPTHVMAGLAAALAEFGAEGGQPARLQRYEANCRTLTDGMAALGFVPLLAAAVQAPVIVTFLSPCHPQFRFEAVYEALKRRGFIIYPGKLTNRDTFRVGCIGAIGRETMVGFVRAMAETLSEFGIADGRPG